MKLIVSDVSLGGSYCTITVDFDASGKKVIEQAQQDASGQFFLSLGRALGRLEHGEPGQLSLTGRKK